MLALVALAVLAQSSPKAAVVDVSQPDAVYEDVSRALATQVSVALDGAGFEAVRVDENELPEQGCHAGPCLAKVAKDKKALVLVTLDATELDKKRTQVAVAALLGLNGMPLAGGRYVSVEGQKKLPKELVEFVKKVFDQAQKAQKEIEEWKAAHRADAGSVDGGNR
ncbi:MAG: hypothetical protein QM723_19910 [Myxococcaceae bacterium]